MAAIVDVLEVAASQFSIGIIIVMPQPFLKISWISEHPFKSYRANGFFKMAAIAAILEVAASPFSKGIILVMPPTFPENFMNIRASLQELSRKRRASEEGPREPAPLWPN